MARYLIWESQMATSGKISEIERPGVLNRAQILRLIQQDVIKGWDHKWDIEGIGKSSLDLHIGERYWKLPAGFKCRDNQQVSELIRAAESALKIQAKVLPDSGLEIKKGKTYLFELQEEVCLKENYYGQGTGKSSIGRLDVLTRLLVDGEEKYDSINPGNGKRLYVEVTPLSFPILIGKGYPIYQLRICKGAFEMLRIDQNLLKLYSVVMVDKNGNENGGIKQQHLRLDLTPTECSGIDKPVVAFKAKLLSRSSDALDLDAKEDTYIPENYWEAITENSPVVKIFGGKIALKVEKNKFYILRSQERLTLPPNIAVYAIAMTEEVGELRIHHAGFVHPCFGRERTDDNRGTPLIFEVRGHDVNMFLMDGDLMAEIHYYPMSQEVPKDAEAEGDVQSKAQIDDPYAEQELKLSKIFKDFGHANRNP